LSVLADRHHDIIFGLVEPTEKDFDLMYEEFEIHYKEHEHFVYNDYPHVDRKQVFKESVHRWRKHNSDPSKTWTMGLTKFADTTEEEFKEYTDVGAPQELCNAMSKPKSNKKQHPLLKDKEIPLKMILPIDWRMTGVVSSVKNQGKCGSCWTFSAAAALESHWAISTRTLPTVDISE
jgi:cathepsin L